MNALEFLPQFDVPFRFGLDGLAATVEQDSPAEIGAAVYDLIVCPRGAKLNDPDFGIPSPLFAQLPLDPEAIIAAIEAQEPRAQIVVRDATASELQLRARELSILGPTLVTPFALSDGGLVLIGGSGAVMFAIEVLVAGGTG